MWKPGTKGPGHIERTSDEKTDVVINKMQHLPLTTQRQRLPIYCNRSHILYLLENYRTLVIVGETGSGKSTQASAPADLNLACHAWQPSPLHALLCSIRTTATSTVD